MTRGGATAQVFCGPAMTSSDAHGYTPSWCAPRPLHPAGRVQCVDARRLQVKQRHGAPLGKAPGGGPGRCGTAARPLRRPAEGTTDESAVGACRLHKQGPDEACMYGALRGSSRTGPVHQAHRQQDRFAGHAASMVRPSVPAPPQAAARHRRQGPTLASRHRPISCRRETGGTSRTSRPCSSPGPRTGPGLWCCRWRHSA